MKVFAGLFSLLMLGLSCYGAEMDMHRPTNKTDVRIVPVTPTNEADNVILVINFPKENQVINKTSVDVQLRIDGYPLGNPSDFERKKEIYNDPQGQSVRVFIDDYPYLSIYQSFIDTLDDSSHYYEQTLNVDVPYDLDPGMHVIRAFPVRSYGESLKDEGCFAASVFYYRSRTDNLKVNTQQPYITYNEPQGRYTYREQVPLLLDFYVTNAQLSKDGYKVRITIDGKTKRLLTAWMPFYIYGLKKGTHTIRLELLDAQNKKVGGLFNDVEKKVSLN